MKTILLFISFLLLTSCTTSPHKAQTLDVQMDTRERVSSGLEIGIRKGELVAQKQVLVREELRLLQNEVYSLEARIYGGIRYLENPGLYGELKTCYVRIARHTGQVAAMSESRDYVVPEEEYEIGLDAQRTIVGLHREYLKDRIARFKQYRQILTQRATEYEDKISLCELQNQKLTGR